MQLYITMDHLIQIKGHGGQDLLVFETDTLWALSAPRDTQWFILSYEIEELKHLLGTLYSFHKFSRHIPPLCLISLSSTAFFFTDLNHKNNTSCEEGLFSSSRSLCRSSWFSHGQGGVLCWPDSGQAPEHVCPQQTGYQDQDGLLCRPGVGQTLQVCRHQGRNHGQEGLSHWPDVGRAYQQLFSQEDGNQSRAWPTNRWAETLRMSYLPLDIDLNSSFPSDLCLLLLF